MRFNRPHSSSTVLKISPPRTIQTVVLDHEPKAADAGTIPLTIYKDGKRIAETSRGNSSNAIISIINSVIIKKSFRLTVKFSETGIKAMISGIRILMVQPICFFLSKVVNILSSPHFTIPDVFRNFVPAPLCWCRIPRHGLSFFYQSQVKNRSQMHGSPPQAACRRPQTAADHHLNIWDVHSGKPVLSCFL